MNDTVMVINKMPLTKLFPVIIRFIIKGQGSNGEQLGYVLEIRQYAVFTS